MATLQSQKTALRNAIAAKLRSLSAADVRQQAQAITDHVLASPFFRRSTHVSCYLSMPAGEVDTSPLIAEILRAGKTLFVPKIDVTTDGRMDFLKVYGEQELRDFPAGRWGIKEPAYESKGERRPNALDADSEPLDVIFVPGVAFDRSLSRLGHGKGYYDRFISSYTSSKCATTRRKPLLVALALREQILEAGQVPTAGHDWQMDVIAGPDGLLGTYD